MQLFLVHCGYYDKELLDGVYEQHVNLFVVAENFDSAKLAAKQNPLFKGMRMHVDGMQQVTAVEGYRIETVKDESLNGESRLVSSRHE